MPVRKKPEKTPIESAGPLSTTRAFTSVFDALPDSAFIRESQLVQSPKRPDVPALLPFSAATLWRKVKAGTFPQPYKFNARITCWNVGSIRAWLAAQVQAQA